MLGHTANFRVRAIGFSLLAGMAGLPGAALATPSFIAPIGLAPGADYRIMFTTSGSIDALSPDIATYDAFVTAAAATNPLLPTTSWRVLGSTLAVSAIDHLACTGACATAPIYSTAGTLLGTNLANLFSFGPPYGVYYNELGQTGLFGTGEPWTGINNDGTTATGDELGAADQSVAFGCSPSYGPTYWAYCAPIGGGFAPVERQLYALSGTYTATDTPEPLSGALLASGMAVLALARKRRAARAG